MSFAGHMAPRWKYSRWQPDTSVEIGCLQATAARSLVPHFHNEVQLVSVRRGWRRFSTPAEVFHVCEGEILMLPAGMPHASSASARSSVTNVYLPADHAAVCVRARPQLIRSLNARKPEDILDAIGSLKIRDTPNEHDETWMAMRDLVAGTDARIADLASQLEYSTDGFIRAFRSNVGITPAAYRLAHRLTVARKCLRSGEAPVDAAYDAAFADQSHLGRSFVRAYGTTPTAYRSAFL